MGKRIGARRRFMLAVSIAALALVVGASSTMAATLTGRMTVRPVCYVAGSPDTLHLQMIWKTKTPVTRIDAMAIGSSGEMFSIRYEYLGTPATVGTFEFVMDLPAADRAATEHVAVFFYSAVGSVNLVNVHQAQAGWQAC